jgi:hypothetical protein
MSNSPVSDIRIGGGLSFCINRAFYWVCCCYRTVSGDEYKHNEDVEVGADR